MSNIIKLLLGGVQSKLSKSVLADDVVSQLLPDYSDAPRDSCPMRDPLGNLSWVPVIRKVDGEAESSITLNSTVPGSTGPTAIRISADGDSMNPIIAFEGDGHSMVTLRYVASPNTAFDAANKRYVDEHTPLYITFTGVSDNDDAACNVDWSTISAAIVAGRPISARYSWTFSDLVYYRDLVLEYNTLGLRGQYLHIDDVTDPGSGYDHVEVNMSSSNIDIVVYSV